MVAAFVVAVAVGFLPGIAGAGTAVGEGTCSTTSTWDGSESNAWSDPDNWTPSVVPDSPTACAVIPTTGFDPTLDTDAQVLDVDLLATATLGGCGGTTLEVSGLFTLASTNATPLFTELGSPCSGGGVSVLHLVPGGVLEKTSAGISTVHLVMDDDGAVRSSGGPLHLMLANDAAGSIESTGTFGAPGGGVVGLGGGLGRSFVLDGAILAGNVHLGIPGAEPGGFVSAASVDVRGTVTASDENFLTGSIVTGPGILLLPGPGDLLHWANDGTGGTRQEGSGTTHVGPGAELRVDGAIGVSLEGTREIWNEGMVRLTAGGYIAADAPTTMDNDGTFRIENDLGYYQGTVVGGGHFENGGVLVKAAGTGTSIVDADYSGDGAVKVLSGTLQIWGGNPGDDLHGSLSNLRTLGTGSTVSPAIDDDPDAPVTNPSPLPFSSVVRNRVAKRTFTIEQDPPGPAPFVGKRVLVTAPGRMAAGVKATVTIRLRADQLEPGDTAADFVVLNVGKPVPRCTSLAPPTPTLCASGRILANGDLRFSVYSSAVVDSPTLAGGPSKRCCAIRLKRCCAGTEGAEPESWVRTRGPARP